MNAKKNIANVAVAVAASKKVVAKKKAAKKTAKKAVVSDKVMKARATRNAVKADGKEYGSVFKAFQSLRLPIGRHASFRKRLKAAGKLAFESGKRTIKFEIVKN